MKKREAPQLNMSNKEWAEFTLYLSIYIVVGFASGEA